MVRLESYRYASIMIIRFIKMIPILAVKQSTAVMVSAVQQLLIYGSIVLSHTSVMRSSMSETDVCCFP